MAYSDYYDVPIATIEYINLGSDPRSMAVQVRYLDGSETTYRTEEDIRAVTRQLQVQHRALLEGETLKVVHPQVPHSFDGLVWAQEFMRMIVNRGIEIDESLMVSWFANALERGFDEGQSRARTVFDGDILGGSRWGYPHVLG